MSKSKILLILLIFITHSCSSVQEAVFPSLSDEEVVAPPALEEVPTAVEDAAIAQNNQEIPPSQYAPPPVPQPQVSDTGPTGTFVGGKITQFRGCLLYTSPSPRDLSTSRMPSSA